MRIFMLGWEFPPYISGGLGTACEGLTRGLSRAGAEITFVLPRCVEATEADYVRLLTPKQQTSANSPTITHRASHAAAEAFNENVSFRVLPTTLSSPYSSAGAPTCEHVERFVEKKHSLTQTSATPQPSDPPVTARYEGDLFADAQQYAELCVQLAQRETFDVIHAHDWLTFPAAMAVAAISGKPFVAHIHSTEFDRAGETHINQRVYDIERQGCHAATRVIAVSHLTRRLLEKHYQLDPARIDVVYNGIENGTPLRLPESRLAAIHPTDKIVLYLGRITMQKGPEYFIEAAKKVLSVMDGVKFVMAGSGDMVKDVMRLAEREGIAGQVLFAGFLRGSDVQRVFEMADVFVMPSVSEPFGIAALEAISHDVPVIVSKQSGVCEVVRNALKVDFWDTEEIANKIVAVLRHPTLARTLTELADMELRTLTWSGAAEKCLAVYDRARCPLSA